MREGDFWEKTFFQPLNKPNGGFLIHSSGMDRDDKGTKTTNPIGKRSNSCASPSAWSTNISNLLLDDKSHADLDDLSRDEEKTYVINERPTYAISGPWRFFLLWPSVLFPRLLGVRIIGRKGKSSWRIMAQFLSDDGKRQRNLSYKKGTTSEETSHLDTLCISFDVHLTHSVVYLENIFVARVLQPLDAYMVHLDRFSNFQRSGESF